MLNLATHEAAVVVELALEKSTCSIRTIEEIYRRSTCRSFPERELYDITVEPPQGGQDFRSVVWVYGTVSRFLIVLIVSTISIYVGAWELRLNVSPRRYQ